MSGRRPGSRSSRSARALAAVVLVAGCGGDDTAAPEAASAEATFHAINADIFMGACTLPCHSGGVNAAGGLDMKVDPFAKLVGAAPAAPQCAGIGIDLVTPGDPEQSLLYRKVAAKIDGTDPPCGEGMPSGPNKAALTPEEGARIRDWIAAGARDD